MDSSERCLLLAANFQNQMRFVVFPIIFPLGFRPRRLALSEPRLLRVTSGSRMLPSSSSAAGGLTRTGSVTLWSEDVQRAESLL